MKQKKGKDNAQSLFGLEEIPCDNQITLLGDDLYSQAEPDGKWRMKAIIFSKIKDITSEHNFGHGQENLAEILLSLNLLAFLFHNVLDLVNGIYQKIQES